MATWVPERPLQLTIAIVIALGAVATLVKAW
jgi:hypothetical protein